MLRILTNNINPASTADNHLVGSLVAPRSVSKGLLAPGALGRGHADPRLALAAAMGVIPGAHHHASHRGSPSQPAGSASLAQVDVGMIHIAHLANRGHALAID